MSLSARIQDQFQAGIQVLQDSLDLLAEPIGQAVELVTASLLQEGKILVCGNGASAWLGRYLAGTLVQGLEQDRPGLAALFMTGGAKSPEEEAGLDGGLPRQVECLGQPGDVLCVVSTFGVGRNLLQAIRVAHGRDMRVVLLTGAGGDVLAAELKETDVVICAPAESRARIVETQLLAIHSLCDGIDYLLLGV
jgi:D-sedoheptulose 7-phosphate isomerase